MPETTDRLGIEEANQATAIAVVEKFLETMGYERSWGTTVEELTPHIKVTHSLAALLFSMELVWDDIPPILHRIEVRFGNLNRGLYWDVVFAAGDPIADAAHFEVVMHDRGELYCLTHDGAAMDGFDAEALDNSDVEALYVDFVPDQPPPCVPPLPNSIFADALSVLQAYRDGRNAGDLADDAED